ncbi:hypothetical protein PV08_10099 [Exophiala spinifera]|uniref:Transcription factor domain-containing protein n=1 Tax=Exophiala spinifera TaxID=91928 RepID=A0A0D2AWC3_9EURO|nr:uncharacterized protein PV08_10099 [Exophiala spinifera]KIW10800.1 hypothetical protein PV08_10099 [Exophiala spinifera]
MGRHEAATHAEEDARSVTKRVRCLKAGFPCSGYRPRQNGTFRQSSVSHPPYLSKKSKALDLVEVPNCFPQAWPDINTEACALSAFFQHFTDVSRDPTISRGYLDGLEDLFRCADSDAHIQQACRIMAFACLGSRLKMPALLVQARSLYIKLLHSFSRSLLKLSSQDVIESLVTAVLLGLYELVTAGFTKPSDHDAHSKGVAAILCTTNSPLELVRGRGLFQLAHSLWRKGLNQTLELGVAPSSKTSKCNTHLINGPEFDHSKLYRLLSKAETLMLSQHALSEDVNELLEEAYLWDRDLARWPASRPYEAARASTVQPQMQSQLPSWWPPTADTYFDLYVAATWNTYRKNRLLLLNVIIQCLERLQEKDAHGRKQAEAAGLARDIMASIPFHLTYASEGLRQVSNHSIGGIAVGKTIGGMLLMHPLCVASNLSIVPAQLRTQMRECLAWIGEHMAIGQASVFSTVSCLPKVHELELTSLETSVTFPADSIVHGYVLLWAGMLLRPKIQPAT